MGRPLAGFKAWIYSVILAAMVIVNLNGCGTDVRLVVYGEHHNNSIQYWEREAKSYFDEDVVMIVGHGGLNDKGVWIIQNQIDGSEEPVEYAVFRARRDFPGRRIILICCNEAGVTLNFPGVSYAKENVWFYPDSIFEPGHNLDQLIGQPGAGDYRDFVHNPW